MINLENIQFVISIATLLGIVFAIYKYFRTPDEKAATEILILKRDLEEQKKMSFEMVKTNQNCIHGLEEKIKGQQDELGKLSNKVVELATIINERIPKK